MNDNERKINAYRTYTKVCTDTVGFQVHRILLHIGAATDISINPANSRDRRCPYRSGI
jgi:hypothetical protein